MKIAVITGTSSGIGKAIADRLLKMDYKVYGISRDVSDIGSPNFVWIKADLTRENEISVISSQINEDKIDLLINNAGVAFEQGSLNFSQNDFDSLFSVNFKAPILILQNLRQKLNNAAVINISSVSDRLVGEMYALYCSSKAALNAYFDVVALEEPSMKFLSILPSYVDTPLLRELQKTSAGFDWSATIKPEQIAEFISNVVTLKHDLPSGAKVIIVTDGLKEDLEYSEKLWGYNVTADKLTRLERKQSVA